MAFPWGLSIFEQLVEGVSSKLGLVVLHVGSQCSCSVVATIAHGTLVRFLSIMGLLVDLEVITGSQH